jgi:hypothetical protein
MARPSAILRLVALSSLGLPIGLAASSFTRATASSEDGIENGFLEPGFSGEAGFTAAEPSLHQMVSAAGQEGLGSKLSPLAVLDLRRDLGLDLASDRRPRSESPRRIQPPERSAGQGRKCSAGKGKPGIRGGARDRNPNFQAQKRVGSDPDPAGRQSGRREPASLDREPRNPRKRPTLEPEPRQRPAVPAEGGKVRKLPASARFHIAEANGAAPRSARPPEELGPPTTVRPGA